MKLEFFYMSLKTIETGISTALCSVQRFDLSEFQAEGVPATAFSLFSLMWPPPRSSLLQGFHTLRIHAKAPFKFSLEYPLMFSKSFQRLLRRQSDHREGSSQQRDMIDRRTLHRHHLPSRQQRVSAPFVTGRRIASVAGAKFQSVYPSARILC